jgi:hypothetical protein
VRDQLRSQVSGLRNAVASSQARVDVLQKKASKKKESLQFRYHGDDDENNYMNYSCNYNDESNYGAFDDDDDDDDVENMKRLRSKIFKGSYET